MSFYGWRPYVPVAKRRAKAHKQMEKLRKQGHDIQPITLTGKAIAKSFWGKGWCDHLESFSDFDNRLPRGRTYVRNGSVCHLEIQTQRIEAFVIGSNLYEVTIEIAPIVIHTWDAIKEKCRGQIGSVLELLQGNLSDHVMHVVCDRVQGLFPQPDEIKLKCSCPDWAAMCKHVAAVLYGVGSRLDQRPELLFLLRGVDASELISDGVTLPTGAPVATADALDETGLAEIFGIDLDTGDTAPAPPVSEKKARKTMRAIRVQSTATIEEKPAKKKTKPSSRRTSPPAFDPKAPTGSAIAHLREQAGLSVAEFAYELDVSLPTVYRWENTPGPLRLQIRPLRALEHLQKKCDGR